MKKLFIYLNLISFVVFPSLASANLEITEIMYDPKGVNTNHQWVEVYNNSDVSVSIDASKWRFNDGSSHYVNNKVGFSVPARAYFILTGDKNTFSIDHPEYGGTVIDTSMALDKDGGVVSIINDGTTIDTVTYSSAMGGAEDGNSIQKSGSTWLSGVPTIGSAYQNNAPISQEQNIQNDQNTSTGSSSNSSESVLVKTKTSKISTEIISKSLVTAGVDFNLKQKTIGLQKETITNGRLVWNFGDGMSKDTGDFNKSFPYRYDYPGEYLVTLSYYKDYFTEEPEATDKLLIRVVSAGLSISSVGTIDNPYVEIENKSSYELIISGWKIQGVKNIFKFANGTTIMPGKKIKLPSRITGFDFSDLSAVSIYSPAGELFATYPNTQVSQSEQKINTKSPINKNTIIKTKDKYSKVINLDDISASSVKSGVEIPWHIVVFVIGLAMFAAGVYLYYLNNKNSLFKKGDSLDSKIRPEDIDILE
jgi:hypothetical protein